MAVLRAKTCRHIIDVLQVDAQNYAFIKLTAGIEDTSVLSSLHTWPKSLFSLKFTWLENLLIGTTILSVAYWISMSKHSKIRRLQLTNSQQRLQMSGSCELAWVDFGLFLALTISIANPTETTDIHKKKVN